MALQLVSLKKVKQPLKNTYSNSALFDDNMRSISANLFARIRESPELSSMLDTLVCDHFMGPVDFFDAQGKPLGPTRLRQVEQFWRDQDVQGSAFYGQGIDFFADGSSFGWYASAATLLSAKQKEQIVKIKALNGQLGSFAEEQMNLPRKISYLAASTVEIKNNEFGELFYVQDTAGERVWWGQDQVVHLKLMDFNGEIRGFSPLKALIREIVLMYLLKDNIWAKLENGGSADNLISYLGTNGVSRARFNRLKVALESFSHLKKSHGNMAIDGDVKVYPLGSSLKDMEYRELAMFIISEYALALGLPTSRLPFLMTGSGGASNKGELSGNSEDSYQTKINARRSKFENGWNRVFQKANFTFKFRRDNLQDDVRETQASVQRTAYVQGIQNSLMKSKKRLTITAQLALLSGAKMNITEEDVEDIPEEDLMSQMGSPFGSPGGMGGRMQPGNSQLKSKLTQDKSEAKEKTASNNERYK